MNEKTSLRSSARAYLASRSQSELHRAGQAIAEHLATTTLWSAAATVYLFVSMRDEIDTRPLIDRVRTDGKMIAVPRIVAGKMEFVAWDGEDASLEVGPYGIAQPQIHAPVLTPSSVDDAGPLVITPGLAFGRNGSRLGRGGGYYDRYLATYRSTVIAVGICLSALLYDTVPESANDVRVDAVACENGITRAKRYSNPWTL